MLYRILIRTESTINEIVPSGYGSSINRGIWGVLIELARGQWGRVNGPIRSVPGIYFNLCKCCLSYEDRQHNKYGLVKPGKFFD
ncbi:hypothetical protein [Flagellimonas sp. HSM57]|uniref:hypothetical protein n=1 Tax=Flagellimonas sp. HSM57 TaxID=2654675 RepID=UPI0013D0978C|nr:hypothetical protein [Flagellimonas sp. HSM57]